MYYVANFLFVCMITEKWLLNPKFTLRDYYTSGKCARHVHHSKTSETSFQNICDLTTNSQPPRNCIENAKRVIKLQLYEHYLLASPIRELHSYKAFLYLKTKLMQDDIAQHTIQSVDNSTIIL